MYWLSTVFHRRVATNPAIKVIDFFVYNFLRYLNEICMTLVYNFIDYSKYIPKIYKKNECIGLVLVFTTRRLR